VLLTFLWCGPILSDPAHTAADFGDPLHMAWAMAWVAHQVVRDPLALFQANAFYPYRNSLAFGDHLLPEGLLGLPVNLMTGNAVLALNLVTGFGLFSSALVAGFVIAKLLGSRGAGLVAGTFLAFNGFMQGELLRVNVIQLQGWSLALLFLWKFTNEPSWRNGWAFSLSLALQGLTGTYYAIYSALLAPGIVLAAYLAIRRRPRMQEVYWLALPALTIGLAGFLFLSPYRRVAAESVAQKPIPDGADVASFFLPGPDFWLLGGRLPAAPHGESNHFLGYVPLALGLAGFLTLRADRGERPAVRSFLALTGGWFLVVGATISIGAFPRFMGVPLGTSPYRSVLNAVPTLRGMATVERAGVLLHVGLALLAAIGAERAFRGRRVAFLALAIASLGAAEQWTRPGPGFRVPAGSELPPVYRYLATGTGPVIEVPVYPDRFLRSRALYLYFSTYHWRPVPIGRASFYPPAHDYLASLLQGFPDALSIEALRALNIRDIVVHPRMWASRRKEKLRALDGPEFDLLQTFPGAVSQAAADLDLGDERVYRLSPGAPSEPPCVPQGEVDAGSAVLTSNAKEGLTRLLELDLGTSWSTVRPQKEGDWVQLTWTQPHTIAAIRMVLGLRWSDFPIGLRVEAQSASGEWETRPELNPVASAVETLMQLARHDPQASVTVRVEPVETRGIRLVVGRDADRPPWNPWSVTLLHLFSGCVAPGISAAGKS
jgi:hypothetical protein